MPPRARKPNSTVVEDLEEEDAGHVFEMDEAELQSQIEDLFAFVNGIGTTPTDSAGAGVFMLGPKGMSCLRAIDAALDEDDAKRQPLHARLGVWSFSAKRAVPVLLAYRDKPDVIFALLQILIRLTAPLAPTLEAGAVERVRHQQQTKLAFANKDLVMILLSLLEAPVLSWQEKGFAGMSDADKDMLDIVLLFFRNLLVVVDPSDAVDASARLHDRFLLALSRGGFFSLLLWLTQISNANAAAAAEAAARSGRASAGPIDHFALLLMEITFNVFRNEAPEDFFGPLAGTGPVAAAAITDGSSPSKPSSSSASASASAAAAPGTSTASSGFAGVSRAGSFAAAAAAVVAKNPAAARALPAGAGGRGMRVTLVAPGPAGARRVASLSDVIQNKVTNKDAQLAEKIGGRDVKLARGRRFYYSEAVRDALRSFALALLRPEAGNAAAAAAEERGGAGALAAVAAASLGAGLSFITGQQNTMNAFMLHCHKQIQRTMTEATVEERAHSAHTAKGVLFLAALFTGLAREHYDDLRAQHDRSTEPARKAWAAKRRAEEVAAARARGTSESDVKKIEARKDFGRPADLPPSPRYSLAPVSALCENEMYAFAMRMAYDAFDAKPVVWGGIESAIAFVHELVRTTYTALSAGDAETQAAAATMRGNLLHLKEHLDLIIKAVKFFDGTKTGLGHRVHLMVTVHYLIKIMESMGDEAFEIKGKEKDYKTTVRKTKKQVNADAAGITLDDDDDDNVEDDDKNDDDDDDGDDSDEEKSSDSASARRVRAEDDDDDDDDKDDEEEGVGGEPLTAGSKSAGARRRMLDDDDDDEDDDDGNDRASASLSSVSARADADADADAGADENKADDGGSSSKSSSAAASPANAAGADEAFVNVADNADKDEDDGENSKDSINDLSAMAREITEQAAAKAAAKVQARADKEAAAAAKKAATAAKRAELAGTELVVETRRMRKGVSWHAVDFIRELAQPQIVRQYVEAAEQYRTNSDLMNEAVFKLLSRVAFDLNLPGMLFHFTVMVLADDVLNEPLARKHPPLYRAHDFCKRIATAFITATARNELLYVEATSWCSARTAEYIADPLEWAKNHMDQIDDLFGGEDDGSGAGGDAAAAAEAEIARKHGEEAADDFRVWLAERKEKEQADKSSSSSSGGSSSGSGYGRSSGGRGGYDDDDDDDNADIRALLEARRGASRSARASTRGMASAISGAGSSSSNPHASALAFSLGRSRRSLGDDDDDAEDVADLKDAMKTAAAAAAAQKAKREADKAAKEAKVREREEKKAAREAAKEQKKAARKGKKGKNSYDGDSESESAADDDGDNSDNDDEDDDDGDDDDAADGAAANEGDEAKSADAGDKKSDGNDDDAAADASDKKAKKSKDKKDKKDKKKDKKDKKASSSSSSASAHADDNGDSRDDARDSDADTGDKSDAAESDVDDGEGVSAFELAILSKAKAIKAGAKADAAAAKADKAAGKHGGVKSPTPKDGAGGRDKRRRTVSYSADDDDANAAGGDDDGKEGKSSAPARRRVSALDDGDDDDGDNDAKEDSKPVVVTKRRIIADDDDE